MARHPVKEMIDMAGPLLKSVTKKKGSSVRQRAGNLRSVSSILGKTVKSQRIKEKDPLALLRQKIITDKERLKRIEREVKEEIQAAVEKALLMNDGQAGRNT